jgi:hypothetical protein
MKAIEERVRFVRARMGKYEMIDFVAMLIGYAISGERTLSAFSQRVRPFADVFMALFGRSDLPDPATLSRYLAALDQPCVEALRTLFLEDLLARFPFGTPPGGLWDRLGNQWMIIDVDGTRQAARQRAHASRPLICLLPIAALISCVLPDTWGANEEKSCAREPPCCKHIPTNGWARSEILAMARTAANSSVREQ